MLFDADRRISSLPPAIAPMRRRLLLAALVQRWDATRAASTSRLCPGRASWRAALAQFIDEAETQGADLAKLEDLAPEPSPNIGKTCANFSTSCATNGPKLLAAEGAINPAARRNLALAALAKRYRGCSRPKAR